MYSKITRGDTAACKSRKKSTYAPIVVWIVWLMIHKLSFIIIACGITKKNKGGRNQKQGVSVK